MTDYSRRSVYPATAILYQSATCRLLPEFFMKSEAVPCVLSSLCIGSAPSRRRVAAPRHGHSLAAGSSDCTLQQPRLPEMILM